MSPSDGIESRFRAGFETLRSQRAVWFWAAALVVVTVWMELRGGPTLNPAWYHWLGLSREGVFSGRIWQVFSYGLLHGNLVHLAVNCGLLIGIGASVERMLGARGLSLALCAGVVSGGVFHLLLGSGLLVGVSGGCTALLLVLTTLSPESRMFPLPVSARNLGLGVLSAAAVMTAIQPSLGIPGLSAAGRWMVDAGAGSWFQIGHACHLGGALAGWGLGRWILRPRVTLEKLQRDRARREARLTR